jgi:pyruvate carboxylase
MTLKKLLIANRGEIAIRVTEAAAELGLETATIFSEDDARSLHVIRADEAHPLRGTGTAAYLDADQIVAVAQHAGCDAIHPGYGFLSEHAGFARQCAAAGIVFVGPRPEVLEMFGNKVRARQIAHHCGVPVLAGSEGPISLAAAKAFFQSVGTSAAIVIKALTGGGGRGMRVVRSLDAVEEAYQRCQSEARAAFGNGEVYVEQFMPAARHIEVQILGDQSGHIAHLWERECTLQRRHQKFIEIAPAPLSPHRPVISSWQQPSAWRDMCNTRIWAPLNFSSIQTIAQRPLLRLSRRIRGCRLSIP